MITKLEAQERITRNGLRIHVIESTKKDITKTVDRVIRDTYTGKRLFFRVVEATLASCSLEELVEATEQAADILRDAGWSVHIPKRKRGYRAKHDVFLEVW